MVTGTGPLPLTENINIPRMLCGCHIASGLWRKMGDPGKVPAMIGKCGRMLRKCHKKAPRPLNRRSRSGSTCLHA